jgi:TP901 family phage tail tape measure protein
MAERINIEIVGSANFKPVYAEVDRLRASMATLSKQTIGTGFTSDTISKLKQAENGFLSTINSLRNFNVETVKLSTATDHLTEKLVRGKFSASEYFSMWKTGSKGTVDELEKIAAAQARVAQSTVLPSVTKQGYAQVITDTRGMADAAKQAEIYQSAYNKAMLDGSNKLINFGKNTQWAGRQLMVGFTVPLAAAGAGLATMYYQVDKNLQLLQRTYAIGGQAGQAFSKMLPSQAELDMIKQQVMTVAQQMSNMYGQSAQETTAVAAGLSAAGYTQDQLLNLTKTVSQAMVLGETDQQSAMKATISLQTAYKLSTTQTADAMNFFSAAQAATSTTMKDLIDAIPRVGPIVRNLGGTYKDTVAFLVAMKEGGVGAADGANALKNSLQRLIVPTKSAVDALKAYGIDLPNIVKSNTGNVVGMVESLQMALDKLPALARQQAITELFGKFQAARVTALLDNFNRTGTQSAKVMGMMSLNSKELGDIAQQQTNVLQQSTSGRFQIAVESLKTSLLPIGQAFLELATKVINAATGIVNIFQKLGPLKYILGGLFAGGAIFGPILMLTGLFANLFGQIFKINNLFRMFKQGFTEGGGMRSPVESMLAGFKNLGNYFQEIDKAQVASKILSDEVSTSIKEQETLIKMLTKAISDYANEVENASRVIGPGKMGGLGGPPMPPPTGGGSGGGPSGTPMLPTSPPASPAQVAAISYYTTSLEAMVKKGLDEEGNQIRRNLVEKTANGLVDGITFSHGIETAVTERLMGTRAVVPGIFTNNQYGKEINLKNQDQPLPIIPPQMMNDEVIAAVLKDLSITPTAPLATYGKELSLVSATKMSGDQLAQLRAMQEAERIKPGSLKSFQSLHTMGAGASDVDAWFSQALGKEQWSQMRVRAMKDVKDTYDRVFKQVEESLQASGGAGVEVGNLREVSGKFYTSLAGLFNKEYDSMSASMLAAFEVSSTQQGEKLSDAIRDAMKTRSAPAMMNALAMSSNGFDHLSVVFEDLGNVILNTTEKIAQQAILLRDRIAAMSNASMVGAVTPISLPGKIGRVIPKFASGGKINGPGGPKDDLIPAMLSNGEYVVNAAAVDHYGTGFMDSLNNKRMAVGGIVAPTAQPMPTDNNFTNPDIMYASGGQAGKRKGSFTHHRQFGYHPRKYKYASGGLAALSEIFMQKEVTSSAEIEAYLRKPESLYVGNAVDMFFRTRNADALKNVKTEDLTKIIESHQLNNTQQEAALTAALEAHASGDWGDPRPLRNLDPAIVAAGAKSVQDALAQIPGETVRLYRAVRFPSNGVDTGRNLAPGHFGYSTGPIEKIQPYQSMSLDPTLPMNFARPNDIGDTGRVIEIDVPKSAIVGIQGANYSGKPGEREFIVRTDGIPQTGQRYVNPYGIASIRKNADDPFLSRLAPPGPESVKFTIQDIVGRYRKQTPSSARNYIPGWETASEKERYGITPEELTFAQQYLEEKYAMPMSELKKGKYDKMFPTQGYKVDSEDYYIRQMLQHHLGYRDYAPLRPIVSDKPGMASYAWSEPMITGRKNGGIISRFSKGGIAKFESGGTTDEETTGEEYAGRALSIKRDNLATYSPFEKTFSGMIIGIIKRGLDKDSSNIELSDPEKRALVGYVKRKYFPNEKMPKEVKDYLNNLNAYSIGNIFGLQHGHLVGSLESNKGKSRLGIGTVAATSAENQIFAHLSKESVMDNLKLGMGNFQIPTFFDDVLSRNGQVSNLNEARASIEVFNKIDEAKLFADNPMRLIQLRIAKESLNQRIYQAEEAARTGLFSTPELAFADDLANRMAASFVPKFSAERDRSQVKIEEASSIDIVTKFKDALSTIATRYISDPPSKDPSHIFANDLFDTAIQENEIKIKGNPDRPFNKILSIFESGKARLAKGSYISGQGGPKDDMIPAMLSNGEYVVNADAVKHYGVGFVDAINSRKFASGGIARLSEGSGGDSGEPIAMEGKVGRVRYKPEAFSNSIKEMINGLGELGTATKKAATSMVSVEETANNIKSQINKSVNPNDEKPLNVPNDNPRMGGTIVSKADNSKSIVEGNTVKDDAQPQQTKIWKNKQFQAQVDAAKKIVEAAKSQEKDANKELSLSQDNLAKAEKVHSEKKAFDDFVSNMVKTTKGKEQSKWQGMQKASQESLAASEAEINSAKQRMVDAEKMAEDSKKAVMQSEEDLQMLTGAGGKGKGAGLMGMMKKGMGGGMGAMIGGQMLSGAMSVFSSNMAEANGGQQTVQSGALGGAATGISMGSMFGVPGMLVGGIGGAAIGGALAQQQKEAQATTDAVNGIAAAHQKYRDAITVSSDSLSVFGLKAKSITDLSFNNVSGQTDTFRTQVDNLAQAMQNGSDSSKNLIQYLKSQPNDSDIARTLKDQYFGVLQAGGSKDQAKMQLEAAAKAGGVSGMETSAILKSLDGTMKKYGGKGQLSTSAGAFVQELAGAKKIDYVNEAKNLQGAENARVSDAKGRRLQYGAESLDGNTSDLMVGLASLTSGAWAQGALNNIQQRGWGSLFDIKGSRQAMGLGTGGVDETKAVDWIKTLNLRAAGNDFNINDLVTKRDDMLKTVTDKNMSGKDIFGGSDKTLIAAAKAAGLTVNSSIDEVVKGFTKLNGSLADLQSQTGVQESIQKWVGANQDFKAEFVEPIKQALGSLSPDEFKQSIDSMVSSVEKSGGNIKDVVDQISSDMGAPFTQLATQFDNNTVAAKNYLVALNDIAALQNAGLTFNSKDAAEQAAAAISQNPFLSGTAQAQATMMGNIGKDTGALVSGVQNIPMATAKQLQAKQQADAKATAAAVKGINDEIKAKNKYIESIRKEMDARQKLFDKKQQARQQDLTLMGLANDITAARDKGDLLGMALAQSAYNDELQKQNELKAKDAADAKDQKKIDSAQNQINKLQDQAQAMQDAAQKRQDALQKQIDGLGATQTKYAKLADQIQTATNAWTTALESGNGAAATAQKKALDALIAQLPASAQGAAHAQEDAISKEWANFTKNNKLIINADGFITDLQVPQGKIKADPVTGKLSWEPSKGGPLMVVVNGNALVQGSGTNQGVTRDQNRATGGYISGAGGPTSDSIPAMLSDGEYVVRASAVKQYGAGLLDSINSQRFATGGFAGVGRVPDPKPKIDKNSNTQTEPVGYTSAYNRAVAYTRGALEWQGLCQKLAHTIAGAPAWAPSAWDAWNAIPDKYKHNGTPPGGAIAYWGNKYPGHATWIAGKDKTGTTYAVTNDYKRRGGADFVPWNVFASGWGMNYNGWIDWTPGGKLPVGGNIPGSGLPADTPGSYSGVYSSTSNPGVVGSNTFDGPINVGWQMSFANGGPVKGPGGPRSDSIAALISAGEYVVKASAVNKYGVDFMDKINSGDYNPTFVKPISRSSISVPANSANDTSSPAHVEYNINVNVAGTNSSPDEIANAVLNKMRQKERSNSTNRRIG